MAVEVVFAAVFDDVVFEVLVVFDVDAGAAAGAVLAAGAGAGAEVFVLLFDAAGADEPVVESAVVDFFERDFFVVVLPSAAGVLPDAVELAGAAAVPLAAVPPVVPGADASAVDFLLRDFFVGVVDPEASVDPLAAAVESAGASVADFFFLLFEVEPVVLSVEDAL